MVVRFLTEKSTKHMLIILLVCIGLILGGLRWLYFEADRVLSEDTAWKISLTGRFETNKNVTVIYSQRPKVRRYYKSISQRYHHPGLKILTSDPLNVGQIRAKALQNGRTDFLIEYVIQTSQTPIQQLSNNKPALDVKQRQDYLKSDLDMQVSSAALSNLNEFISQEVNNKPELVHKIFQHSLKLVKEKKPRFDNLNNVIKSNKASTLGRAKLMIALCRINDIPARLITGFVLEEGTDVTPYYWVEVYDEEEAWLAYDPEKGYEAKVPINYVVFNYDNPNIFTVENGKLVSRKFTLTEDIDTLNVARLEQEKDFMDVFDLRRLDLDTRETLTKLLILPFCVLLTAFFRHVLGFFPYGTFTAALLALAMVHADPIITLVIAGIVIFLALIGRSILPKTLMRAPRLSLIFTFVAISMVFSVSLLSYFSINPGGSVILLPTIILAAIVDRFYSYMDESGTHAALLRLGVTVLIAIFCIPILQYEDLGVFILGHPEMHLITAALVLALSNYKGPKLTDYKYMRLLGENKPKKKSRKKTPTTDLE